MQQPWTLSVKEFVRHALLCSAVFLLVAIEAMYGSVINSFASHVIASKFVRYVLTALEYTVVVSNALFAVLWIVPDLLRKLRRLMQ